MRNIKSPFNLYVFLISIIGMSFHFIFSSHTLFSLTNIYIKILLIISLSLLNYYNIRLPPKGNSLSLDSSIYIASCFQLGLSFTLNVLLISFLILIIRKISTWWKQILNIAMYSLMIIGFYFTFISLGGTLELISSRNVVPFILSLIVYFIINTVIAILFFALKGNESIPAVLSLLVKDSIALYFVNMLLSMVLIILASSEGIIGYTLFMVIIILLSIAFRQHFSLYQRASQKANRDSLTGLSNHGYFKDILEEKVKAALNTDNPLSLALLDIDDFKKYNDLYGHLQGDSLLKYFGSLLEKECNALDYFVARYGGEEFTILMSNTTSKQAAIFMDHLRKKVNDSYFDGVERLPYHCLSFSAGVAEYEKGVYDSQELLNRADQAMYNAKSQGKNMIRIANGEDLPKNHLAFEKELREIEQQLNIFLSKDVYTYRHSKRVYNYAINFSENLALSATERKTLVLGALVHDIGKLEIPRDVINKKGKLEPHEWEMIKKHVIWGKEIISTNKHLNDLIPLVELHHERYDGKGYPYGLKGKAIPKLARILCIIDSFDAMTTERPYQPTKTFTEGIQELRVCAGLQFDPEYIEPFIKMIQNVYAQQLEMENITV